MNRRLERLRSSLEHPLLVTTPVNVRYLIGFESTNPALLVERERVRLFSDFRYAGAGRAIEGVEFVETARSLLGDLAGRLSGTIAFEAHDVSYAGWQTLGAGGLDLLPTRGLVEALRAVKNEDEIDLIRAATKVTDAAFERLAQERFIGRSERELAWRMEQLLRELGGELLAFPVIVAGGPNAARPHSRPGERRVEEGDTVIVDAGASVAGYCSDCTRTFAAGALSDELDEAYAVCLSAQQSGLEAIRAGVAARDADAAARARIEAAGLGETFGHGLGHGVGLLVHEAPRLTRESEEELSAGNVVTVEPGTYLEGRGGIRIEDLVVVREGGAEVLTSFTKELVSVE